MSLVRSLVRKYQNIWKKDRVIKISIVLSDWKDWKERYRIIRNVPPTKRQKKKYQINI